MRKKLFKHWLFFCISILLLGIIFGLGVNAIKIENKQVFDIFTDNVIYMKLDDGYIDISVEEAWALLNDTSNGVQIPIDVRTDPEWANEHIDTSYPENPKHHCSCEWDNTTILQEFMSLYEGKEIIIYCRSGSRSVTASNMLVDNGFVGTIYNMLGGINAWNAAEFPTVGNLPPVTPTIIGTTNGKSGNEYEYTIVSNDPENDDVSYYIDWGDNNTIYVGPYRSGEEITVKHIWEEKETYIISIKSIDYYLDESEWATLEVSMPKNKEINLPFLSFLDNHPHLFPLMRQLLRL